MGKKKKKLRELEKDASTFYKDLAADCAALSDDYEDALLHIVDALADLRSFDTVPMADAVSYIEAVVQKLRQPLLKAGEEFEDDEDEFGHTLVGPLEEKPLADWERELLKPPRDYDYIVRWVGRP